MSRRSVLTPVLPYQRWAGAPFNHVASPASNQASSRSIFFSTTSDDCGTMTALRPMSSSAVPNLQGVVALVVDDDADTRDIFAMSLMHAGAEVEVAGSAREALTLVRSRVPDVVVTDISMPGADD